MTTLVAFVLVLSAWNDKQSQPTTVAVPAPTARLLPTGLPAPLVISRVDSLSLWLPIARNAVTAIGYHASPDTIAQSPEGRQANEGLFARLYHRIVGDGGSGQLEYYRISGGEGPSTGALDVGAAPRVDVFSPVAGTIVAISNYIVNGKRYGVRLDIRPNDDPTLIVSITHLKLDPAWEVGAVVVSGRSRLGTVVDLSRVEKQALARYTQDEGNHVTIEVRSGAASFQP
jgi:hypothetical protein